ncbi:hypothetical protein [Allosalinactinospora lopnorensis]|uniref:hypothetical protein n=1 Tax=Allosalinactinospora lopnorensis TaxID=1352348 RepID=UPI000623DD81|nr:hypothetical protein [Allosalinactinospora lopnorensis]
MTDEPLSRDEVAASLATGRELGPDYDGAVADALAERLEHAIDQRVDTRITERLAEARPARSREQDIRIAGLRFAMAVVSLVLAVPLTFVASRADNEAGAAVLAVWFGIAAVNAVFLFATRRPRS